jgi:hypothetical protein
MPHSDGHDSAKEEPRSPGVVTGTGLPSCLYGADGTMQCGVVEQAQPFSFQIVTFEENRPSGGCTKMKTVQGPPAGCGPFSSPAGLHHP